MTAANVFHLSGHHVHVAYSTGAGGTLDRLEYQDAVQTLPFTGPDIHVVETDAGTIVSVIIRMTVDTGSTSFSVIIPRTNVDPNATIPIHTYGVTALHRFSVVPAFDKGQLDVLNVIPLSGTAHLLLA